MQQMLLENFDNDILENINNSEIRLTIGKKSAILREGKGFEKIAGIDDYTTGFNLHSKRMDYPFNIVSIRVVGNVDVVVDNIEHEERHGHHMRHLYLNDKHDFTYTKIYYILSEIYANIPVAKKEGWRNTKKRLDQYIPEWGEEYKEPVHKIIDLMDWLQKNNADEKEIEYILLNN